MSYLDSMEWIRYMDRYQTSLAFKQGSMTAVLAFVDTVFTLAKKTFGLREKVTPSVVTK